MQIANPIYDAVFKYLLEDSKIARLLISSIIGENILSLDFLPQEDVIELDQRGLTVYCLDFSARIETPTGCNKISTNLRKDSPAFFERIHSKGPVNAAATAVFQLYNNYSKSEMS